MIELNLWNDHTSQYIQLNLIMLIALMLLLLFDSFSNRFVFVWIQMTNSKKFPHFRYCFNEWNRFFVKVPIQSNINERWTMLFNKFVRAFPYVSVVWQCDCLNFSHFILTHSCSWWIYHIHRYTNNMLILYTRKL